MIEISGSYQRHWVSGEEFAASICKSTWSSASVDRSAGTAETEWRPRNGDPDHDRKAGAGSVGDRAGCYLPIYRCRLACRPGAVYFRVRTAPSRCASTPSPPSADESQCVQPQIERASPPESPRYPAQQTPRVASSCLASMRCSDLASFAELAVRYSNVFIQHRSARVDLGPNCDL